MHNNPLLVIGFKGEILAEFRQNFTSLVSVSEDDSSDINWWTLHELQFTHELPTFSSELFDCLNYVKTNYCKFTDINSRRYQYVQSSNAETYNAFILTFYKCYKLIERNHIELVVFSNIPHEGFDYITYLIAKYFGIITVMCNQTLIPNRFWLCSNVDEMGMLDRSPDLYEVVKSDYALPKEWFYMKKAGRDLSYSLRNIIADILKQSILNIPFYLIRYAHAVQHRVNAKNNFVTPIAGEKYVYFPLHMQPELTTSALGGQFADQLTAIEVVSGLLPENYFLYVKDNPMQTEKHRGKLFYKRIGALKNVKYLHRNLNSMDLIKGSQAVATVTGTVGWEAIFYAKPVLIFGLAWYADFDGVTRYQPGITFKDIVSNMPSANSESIKSLESLMRKAGKGIVDPDYNCLVEDLDDRKNAIEVYRSIMKYLDKICDIIQC
jgi:hypothetical protein